MECESPNRHLYEFVGNIRLDGQRWALSPHLFNGPQQCFCQWLASKCSYFIEQVTNKTFVITLSAALYHWVQTRSCWEELSWGTLSGSMVWWFTLGTTPSSCRWSIVKYRIYSVWKMCGKCSIIYRACIKTIWLFVFNVQFCHHS